MKRLFTGIPVEAGQMPLLAEKADALLAAHPELRWSDRAGWHVTLQFYGVVDVERERLLREQLKQVEAGALEVVLRGMGTFERAGVLWAGAVRSAGLVELQSKIVAVGTQCGFAPEERSYRPHMTLARRKGRSGRWDLKQRGETDGAQEFGRFTARGFVLYESVAGPGGSRYEVIDQYALRG